MMTDVQLTIDLWALRIATEWRMLRRTRRGIQAWRAWWHVWRHALRLSGLLGRRSKARATLGSAAGHDSTKQI
jgi:hypothetical protein